jgi:hypothetical protein
MMPTTSLPADRPDTMLTDAADALLTASSPKVLVDHCRRSFIFGCALLDARGRSYDREVLYVSLMLHDLGLTGTWGDPVVPFEVCGARAARDQLLAAGAKPEQAEVVHDAIALHLELTAADDDRPEVAGVHLGSGLDVAGLRTKAIPAELVARTMELYPRQGLVEFLLTALRREAESKPTSRTAVLVNQLNFLDRVVGAHFDAGQVGEG